MYIIISRHPAAIVATKGEDSLKWGSSRIQRQKAWKSLLLEADLLLEVD
jgi:hypothetical protein